MHPCWRFLAAVAALAWLPAHATQNYCIIAGDSGSLTAALSSAVSVGGADPYVIRLEQGSYALPGSYSFEAPSLDIAHGIQLLGGYAPGTGCNEGQRVLSAANTVFDGQSHAGSSLSILTLGAFSAQGITFRRFVGRLRFYADNVDCGTNTVIDDDAFSELGQGLALTNLGGLRIHDNVFTNNTPGSQTNIAGPLGALQVYQGNCPGYVFNNTIYNTTGNGLVLVSVNGANIYASGNIAWASTLNDVRGVQTTSGDPMPVLEYSDYASPAGALSFGNGNIDADPLFVDAAGGNFQLKTAPILSPAVNVGQPFEPGGFPATDAAGNARVSGGRIDIGAYESSWNDVHQFVVTSAADSGAGTLRAAMTSAASTAGTSQIVFNIPGGCGQLIVLASALADVVRPLTVDATTQPGWSPNNATGAYNATLCVNVVTGAATGVMNAFHASGASSRLTVQGLVLAGFPDAAIRLDAGSGHVVRGNIFSGGGFVPYNHDGVRVSATAAAVLIGGANAADSNLFDNSTGTAVYLDNAFGASSVVRNLIGLAPDGTSAAGNAYGIYVYNSPGNVIDGNFVANSAHDAITLSGAATNGTIVRRNDIGFGFAGAAANGGAGVLVSFGASDSDIGSGFYNTSFGNIIRNSAGPAVWISPSGGNGNEVLGNDQIDNGGAGHDNGLAIDLGALGPDANVFPPTGSGPNGGQNHPLMTHAFAKGNEQIMEGTLDAEPYSVYRIDFFYTPTAPIGNPGRGDGGLFTGRTTFQTDAAGHCHFRVVTSQLLNGDWVSATATSASGDTSEIGNAVQVATDLLFRQGFEGAGPCL